MIKIMFMIHDLGHGGAEKVLVNLVNHLDRNKFDVTVIALFGGGVNEKYLNPDIHYKVVFKHAFPGNSHLMKLFSPEFLHRLFIREHYDIEISYLEGCAARIVSGCTNKATKLVTWVHCTMSSAKEVAIGYRSIQESIACYQKYENVVFVSQGVKRAFMEYCPVQGNTVVLYNTNETSRILAAKDEETEVGLFVPEEICLCGVGKLMPVKGFDRLMRVHARLKKEGYPVHTYVLGIGPEKERMENYIAEHHLENSFSLLGYQTNPYKFVTRCDLFVCASHAEGFSTAATEALIVGTPVCTVEVSGMKEMLGENDEYGIVTDNNEEALYLGIKRLLDDPALFEHYREKAKERGKMFSTENTVRAVEEMLMEL